MFLIYDKKDKKRFLLLKGIVLLLLVVALFAAFAFGEIDAPEFTEQLKLGMGAMLLFVVFLLASFKMFGRIFKLTSAKFILAFAILFLLKEAIDVLVVGTFFMSIPLLFDDIIVENYFKYLHMNKYYEQYKFYMLRKEE